MTNTPITELASDQDASLVPWSEAAMRDAYRRGTRRKLKQAELDCRAGLRRRKAPWVMEREARAAARHDLERGVRVENEARRKQGLEPVYVAVM